MRLAVEKLLKITRPQPTHIRSRTRRQCSERQEGDCQLYSVQETCLLEHSTCKQEFLFSRVDSKFTIITLAFITLFY